MKTTIRYILLTALRDKLFIVLLLGMIIATLIANSLAGTSIVEEHEMMLVFSSAIVRIIVVLGLIVFTAFHVRHAFDTKEIDVLLSRPISRSQLVLSYWLGFALVALFLSLAAIILIAIISPINQIGFLSWSFSLIIEMWLVSAIALFASLMLPSSVVSVMVSLGIYVLSRMMGYFLSTIQTKGIFDNSWINFATHQIIDKLAILVPRLDFFTQSDWLLYGTNNILETVTLYGTQGLIFIPLLLLAATIDFKKRAF